MGTQSPRSPQCRLQRDHVDPGEDLEPSGARLVEHAAQSVSGHNSIVPFRVHFPEERNRLSTFQSKYGGG